MHNQPNKALGFATAVFSYVSFGVLVFYWKTLKVLSSYEVLAFRVLLTAITAGVVLLCTGKMDQVVALVKGNSSRRYTALSALAILGNWGVYIWAIDHNFVTETSLGYFIMPLMTALAGVCFFKEKINRYTVASLVLAGCGVLYLTISYGRIPLIALVVGASYSAYIVLHKKSAVSPLVGLFVETAFLSPLALGYLVWMGRQGKLGVAGVAPLTLGLLACVGAVTILPLYATLVSQKHISLVALGIISYLSPLLQLLIGVLAYHETFTTNHAITLSAVFASLVVFTIGQIKTAGQPKAEVTPAS